MISYIYVDETTIEVTDSCDEAVAFLRDAGIDSAEVWEAPQASLWDAEQAGFDGARRTGRFVFATHDVTCQCGQWSGEACAWSGPKSETVRVEFMPEHLRDSHEAAGNSGSYPHNGAVRIRVERSCAALMAETDGQWVSVV